MTIGKNMHFVSDLSLTCNIIDENGILHGVVQLRGRNYHHPTIKRVTILIISL